MAGALLAMMGVSITVYGLHGMKISDLGRVASCTKPLSWSLSLAAWAFGQLVQLLAVKLAPEPVIGAVSNVAIIVNAFLAARMQNERVTRTDMFAMLWMIAGACLVVGFTPAPVQRSVSLQELNLLFSGSPLAAIGLISTTLLALAALPAALRPAAAIGSAIGSAIGPAAVSPAGSIAFGILAGYIGGTSITMTKLCWLVFDHYSWVALTMGEPWALSVVAFGGEVLMVVALFNGMARHEASIVVPTYYISLTLCSSLQGLCVFQLLREMRPGSAIGFSTGVLLCVLAIGWSSWKRRQLEHARGGGGAGGGEGGGGAGGGGVNIDTSRLLAASWGAADGGGRAGGGRGGGGGGGEESHCGAMAPLEGIVVAPAAGADTMEAVAPVTLTRRGAADAAPAAAGGAAGRRDSSPGSPDRLEHSRHTVG